MTEIVRFTQVNDCDYADHGVELQVVWFAARASLNADALEDAIRLLSDCEELVDFEYDRCSGYGGFVVIPGPVYVGEYSITMPD